MSQNFLKKEEYSNYFDSYQDDQNNIVFSEENSTPNNNNIDDQNSQQNQNYTDENNTNNQDNLDTIKEKEDQFQNQNQDTYDIQYSNINYMTLEMQQMFNDAQTDLKMGLVKPCLQKCETLVHKSHVELQYIGFIQVFNKVIKMLNFSSIDLMNQNKIQLSMQILQKCEQWTILNSNDFGEFPNLKALTLNHIGCNFRRQGNFNQAYINFDNAQKILKNGNSKNYLGLTYLNISALYSQVGNHDKALFFAKQSQQESEIEFERFQEIEQNNQDYDFSQDPEYMNKLTTMVISHHNVAAEEEFFKNYDEALLNYENACRIASQYLSDNHKITVQFKNEYQKFQQRYTQYKLIDYQKRQKERQLENKLEDPQYVDLVGTIIKNGLSKTPTTSQKKIKSKILINKKNSSKYQRNLKVKQQIYGQEFNLPENNLAQQQQFLLKKNQKNNLQINQVRMRTIKSANQHGKSQSIGGNSYLNNNLNFPQSTKTNNNFQSSQQSFQTKQMTPGQSQQFIQSQQYQNLSQNQSILQPSASSQQLQPQQNNSYRKSGNKIQAPRYRPLSSTQNNSINSLNNQPYFKNSQRKKFVVNKNNNTQSQYHNQYSNNSNQESQTVTRSQLLEDLKFQYEKCQNNMKNIEEKIISELEKEEIQKREQKKFNISKPSKIVNKNQVQQNSQNQSSQQTIQNKIIYTNLTYIIKNVEDLKMQFKGKLQFTYLKNKQILEARFTPQTNITKKFTHNFNISDIYNYYTEQTQSNQIKTEALCEKVFQSLIKKLELCFLLKNQQKLIIKFQHFKAKEHDILTNKIPVVFALQDIQKNLEIIQKNDNDSIILLQVPKTLETQQIEQNQDQNQEQEDNYIKPIVANDIPQDNIIKNQEQQQKNNNYNNTESDSEIQPVISPEMQNKYQQEIQQKNQQSNEKNQEQDEQEEEYYQQEQEFENATDQEQEQEQNQEQDKFQQSSKLNTENDNKSQQNQTFLPVNQDNSQDEKNNQSDKKQVENTNEQIINEKEQEQEEYIKEEEYPDDYEQEELIKQQIAEQQEIQNNKYAFRPFSAKQRVNSQQHQSKQQPNNQEEENVKELEKIEKQQNQKQSQPNILINKIDDIEIKESETTEQSQQIKKDTEQQLQNEDQIKENQNNEDSDKQQQQQITEESSQYQSNKNQNVEKKQINEQQIDENNNNNVSEKSQTNKSEKNQSDMDSQNSESDNEQGDKSTRQIKKQANQYLIELYESQHLKDKIQEKNDELMINLLNSKKSQDNIDQLENQQDSQQQKQKNDNKFKTQPDYHQTNNQQKTFTEPQENQENDLLNCDLNDKELNKGASIIQQKYREKKQRQKNSQTTEQSKNNTQQNEQLTEKSEIDGQIQETQKSQTQNQVTEDQNYQDNSIKQNQLENEEELEEDEERKIKREEAQQITQDYFYMLTEICVTNAYEIYLEQQKENSKNVDIGMKTITQEDNDQQHINIDYMENRRKMMQTESSLSGSKPIDKNNGQDYPINVIGGSDEIKQSTDNKNEKQDKIDTEEQLATQKSSQQEIEQETLQVQEEKQVKKLSLKNLNQKKNSQFKGGKRNSNQTKFHF